MAFEKVEYTFPDEKENKKPDIEIEKSSAIEVDISEKSKPEEKKVESKTDDTASEMEVEVVDDTPEADRGRKVSEPPTEVTEEELGEYSEKVRTRIKHFSKGYHDERRAKEQATREKNELERYSQQLIEENKKLKGTVGKNQTAMLEQAKKATEKELESAKKAYKDAYEAGDTDAILAAQETLTSAKIKADKLENFKVPTLQEGDTPVEQNKETAPAMDVRTKKWAEANTWFGTDDEMTSLALGLHTKLVKEKGPEYARTDEYYETIDARMRQLFPENFEGGEKPEVEKPKKRQSNVVAPATRSTAPKKVTLTQTQVSIAKRLGVPLDLYAKQVAEEMRKENG
tara:strand:+ start:7143 stop:8171 length:1029 start_codon:yes stop_codon:yes gene_type:complete